MASGTAGPPGFDSEDTFIKGGMKHHAPANFNSTEIPAKL